MIGKWDGNCSENYFCKFKLSFFLFFCKDLECDFLSSSGCQVIPLWVKGTILQFAPQACNHFHNISTSVLIEAICRWFIYHYCSSGFSLIDYLRWILGLWYNSYWAEALTAIKCIDLEVLKYMYILCLTGC